MSAVFSVPVYVYDVPQRYDVEVVNADFVSVWYTDDVLIIRRGSVCLGRWCLGEVT